MELIKKIQGFFYYIFSNITKKSIEDQPTTHLLEEKTEETVEENFDEEKINVAKRTLMTELYNLEQKITVFENDFPNEYKAFMEKIEQLRVAYNSNLEELKKQLRYEIDPELDSTKTGQVLKLENDIENFIEKEVKFNIISKRLERLITKLNILYNVSILHSEECNKQKAVSQLANAVESAKKVIREFTKCDHILCDKQLKERIVNLASYADYHIFKISVRNSSQTPDKLIENLIMLEEFEGFNYVNAFVAFIKDEISDLGELLPLISDIEYQKILRKKSSDLLTKLTYSKDLENQLVDIDFWKDFLDFESTLFELLAMNGVDKEKIKVGLISRMGINVDKKDILVLPKTNAFLSLTSIYSRTHDEKILLLIKILKNLSNDLTYRELYFLLLLFDAIGVIKNTSNELIQHIEKYIKKYPYDSKTIWDKKTSVSKSSNKEYVIIFTLEDYEKEIITTLMNLNIDFKVVDNKVLVNSFYFNGLESVLSSLQTYTKNMMI